MTPAELTARANHILFTFERSVPLEEHLRQRTRATRTCLRHALGSTDAALRGLADLAQHACSDDERQQWLTLGDDLLAATGARMRCRDAGRAS
ncbi:MAG: hypothetical protein KF878_15245 [Planctomycetes bacterium]|nr:hypothetical protein [Planctomycetota bacterium]